MPAQTVDATPSNALIRQCFPGRSNLFGCPRSKPSQGSVPADLTLASGLAFVFNASRVRLECCVDPLKPPISSGISNNVGPVKSFFERTSLFTSKSGLVRFPGPIHRRPRLARNLTVRPKHLSDQNFDHDYYFKLPF